MLARLPDPQEPNDHEEPKLAGDSRFGLCVSWSFVFIWFLKYVLCFCSYSALTGRSLTAAELTARVGLDGLRSPRIHRISIRPTASRPRARRGGRARGGDSGGRVRSYLGRYGQVATADAVRAAAIAAALQTPLLRVWAEPIPEATPTRGPCVALLRAACDAAAATHHGGDRAAPRLVRRHHREHRAPRSTAIDRARTSRSTTRCSTPADGSTRGRSRPTPSAWRPLACYFHPQELPAELRGRPDAPWRRARHRRPSTTAPSSPPRCAPAIAAPFTIEFLAADERPVETKLAADAASAWGASPGSTSE
jgi:hypothetical protein